MKNEITSLWLCSNGESTDQDCLNHRRPYVVSAITCLLMLFLVVGFALAEEKTGNQAQQSNENAQEEETTKGALEWHLGDNWVFSPVIFPIYSPETEAGLVFGGISTFSTEPKNENVPRSTLLFAVIPSSNDSLDFATNLESFWLDDKLRSGFEFDYKTGPSNYWPVGYEAGREIDKDEDVTQFDRDLLDFPLVAGWRFGKAIFGGINFHVLSMKVQEESETQQIDPNYQEYGDDITNIGAGIRFVYDTRDDTVNAYTGRFFGADATFYREWLGSDQEFEAYTVDYRQYHQIKRPGRTVAWQLYGRVANGDVPWPSKSTVGSSKDLRGYSYGRFRDDAAVWALVEYRHMTNTKLWNIGRNGFAVWGGLGFIGEDLGDLGGHELPNAGVGYRLELQPRRNLRLDLGVGYDEFGFYLSFAEAF